MKRSYYWGEENSSLRNTALLHVKTWLRTSANSKKKGKRRGSVNEGRCGVLVHIPCLCYATGRVLLIEQSRAKTRMGIQALVLWAILFLVSQGNGKSVIVSAPKLNVENLLLRKNSKNHVVISMEDGTDLHIDLWKNERLISPKFSVHRFSIDRGLFEAEFANADPSCYFFGKIVNEAGFAAFSICRNEMNGSVFLHGKKFEYYHRIGEERAKITYAEFDVVLKDVLLEPSNPEVVQTDETSFGGSFSSQQQQSSIDFGEELYVEILLVSDAERYASFGSQDELSAANIEILNLVARFYALGDFDMPIAISIAGEIVLEEGALGISSDENGEMDGKDVLHALNEFRREHLGVLPPHDSMHLLSGKDFKDQTIGLARLGTVCDDTTGCKEFRNRNGVCAVDGSGCCILEAASISQIFPDRKLLGAETVAHEVGHMLSLRHDDSENDCAPDKFLMASSVNISPNRKMLDKTWSRCSYEAFADVLQSAPKPSGFHPYACLTNEAEPLSGFSGSGRNAKALLSLPFFFFIVFPNNKIIFKTNW